MKYHDILITENDRRRLGSMLQDPRIGTMEQRARLHALEMELERAYGVDPTELPEDVVTMNSTVEIRDLKSGETDVYTLVYPDRADIDANRISVLAPIGTAILGCRVGDVVRVATPSGTRRIRVEEVHFQPERAGAYEL